MNKLTTTLHTKGANNMIQTNTALIDTMQFKEIGKLNPNKTGVISKQDSTVVNITKYMNDIKVHPKDGKIIAKRGKDLIRVDHAIDLFDATITSNELYLIMRVLHHKHKSKKKSILSTNNYEIADDGRSISITANSGRLVITLYNKADESNGERMCMRIEFRHKWLTDYDYTGTEEEIAIKRYDYALGQTKLLLESIKDEYELATQLELKYIKSLIKKTKSTESYTFPALLSHLHEHVSTWDSILEIYKAVGLGDDLSKCKKLYNTTVERKPELTVNIISRAAYTKRANELNRLIKK